MSSSEEKERVLSENAAKARKNAASAYHAAVRASGWAFMSFVVLMVVHGCDSCGYKKDMEMLRKEIRTLQKTVEELAPTNQPKLEQ